ncbi:hypothetical protein [Nocardia otitidiscaviarum]|uniref:hypothetical protein n=1 Tax=Nocardia otitidiscaviarum TaxID=1823 RepID=UPI0011C0329D|nr:hypothetical protein [Nocardia otitidiscaviarum]
MNSASQSNPGSEQARQLVDDMEHLTRRGWKLAAPMWFPMLCIAVTTLASVPAAILFEGTNAMGWYWVVVSLAAALACGWYFSTRRVQLPDLRGGIVILAALGLLVSTQMLGWFYRGEWALVAPWLAVGIGLAVFAAALRSLTTAAVALASIAVAVVVGITEPEHGYALLALVVGVTAVLAAMVELVRTDAGTAA